MKQNVTVQLDQTIIRDAKVIAARRATSLSKFLADEIRRIAIQESSYERSRRAALARLGRGYNLGGGKLPAREDIHDR